MHFPVEPSHLVPGGPDLLEVPLEGGHLLPEPAHLPPQPLTPLLLHLVIRQPRQVDTALQGDTATGPN